LLAGVVLALLGASSALGAVRVFDPALSLTGGCTISKVDPAPDPGCPEEEGVPQQPGSFAAPAAATTDFYGNIFISSEKGSEGRVDIFDPSGQFVAQKLVATGAQGLAVDSKGNLYVVNGVGELLRYAPTLYPPKAGEIEYGSTPVLVAKGSSSMAIALNMANDRLFVHKGGHVEEYGSAAEENKLLDDSIGEGDIQENFAALGLAVDAARERIYVSESGPIVPSVVKVFDLTSPHALLLTIDGSEVPAGQLNAFFSLAVDEETGHLLLYSEAQAVYEFAEDGKYLRSIKRSFDYNQQKIWVDNGPSSPNGGLNLDGRYLFVPSHPSGVGHVFAFGPEVAPKPPIVGSTGFAEITEGEAELKAVVNPRNAQTTYVFEYTTRQSFEESGFEEAEIAGEGQLPAGNVGVPVTATAAGLLPDTVYRFRVTAANGEGTAKEEGEFSTYPPADETTCPNEVLRVGPSLPLPDCRAYELVTPADTNARAPIGVDTLGVYFAARQASPAGDAVSFLTEGGTIPGSEGTGSWGGDPYLATRGAQGWGTVSTGPSGKESPALLPGSTSPDQGHSFWSTGSGEGSASIGEKPTSYVRYPDGRSELVGRGSLNTDPRADGKLISEYGSHIIFVSSNGPGRAAIQLEADAPPDGTATVYDRTTDEVTHVVSLLPGSVTPAAGQHASYVGASLDGEGVAFRIGSTLYLRHNNEETYEVGEGVTFAGISEGGERIFYVEGGDLFRFDVTTGETTAFTESGDVTVVNVASSGQAAYFVSPTVLGGENPLGSTAQAGEENLYLSEEGAVSFVGTVTERDVEGEFGGVEQIEGLGLWTAAVGPGASELPGRFAIDPSRTTPDGQVMLFESRANLTAYDSEGHVQVYRYDSGEGELECLSCSPTLASPTGEASLQSITQGKGRPEPFSSFAIVNNLRADGRRAFFQSSDPLVVSDTDELQDVYEWEDEGVGTCVRPGGCVYLISSGHSDRPDYLYAVSDSGDDVFFRSADLLLGIDTDKTPSIYDARVGGGFAEEEEEICQGEGCKPDLTLPPPWPTPGMQPSPDSGNVSRKSCPKGKRKVKRGGKVRCVKKHQKKKRARGGTRKKGGGK
jgi:hypothetical protein